MSPVISDSEPRFAGAHLVGSAFPDDDGTADSEVAGCLAAAAEGAGSRAVQHALLGTRLLVPVVAMLDESEVSETGMRVDKQSSMATVTVVGDSGKRALPVFTSVAALAAWRGDARPSAVSAEHAAAAALAEADALLIDPAGPHRLVLGGAGLRALAAGRPWLALPDDAELRDRLNAAVQPWGGTVEVRPTASAADEADIVVRLEDLAPDVTQAVADQIVELNSLRERVDSGVRILFERHAEH